MIPEISVIVPIYNVEKYVEKCIVSILNQSFENFELILIDDGSTDKSGIIAEQYSEQHKEKILFLRQKNAGLSATRNLGLSHSQGEYIVFIDSDDTIEKEMLQELYRMAKDNDADLTLCAFHSVDDQGNEVKRIIEPNLKMGEIYCLNEKKDLLLIQNAVWNKMFRRDIIKQNCLQFEPDVWYEDFRFTRKYLLYTQKVMYSEQVLYNYLIRKGSIMNSMSSDRNIEILDAFSDVISYYKKKHVYSKYKEELEYLAIEHIYISTSIRLIRGKTNSNLHKKIVEEFKRMFPDYKSNSYVLNFEGKKKFLYKMLNFKLYFIIALMFDIKDFYRKRKYK